MTDLESELNKIKFHINLIGETLDSRENPIPSLVIHMNWDESDLDSAHDIFEKYDSMVEAEEEVNWQAFEMELRDRFGIGYQTVKSIVLAFFRNHQWTEVCTLYAKAYECMEFHEITRHKD
ncbi:hypothetical protein A3754_24485 [Alcanivorax sp. HI0083]|uniref:hypothetical protein n=1 Tax=unclassified Alcanivorax TaxID=2638842 RepID=UPI0007BA6131|nr:MULTISPECIES: hypothetical protein [unclassified Alcanivorax]KZY36775.1 hypothetical protein A3730_12525 [Alcanivorax sp. HI0044]KZZ27280.1 hypothetical protein A3754_01225 [Alcanivorax sp. HI0083]KZZ28532.1 hypothetical protein A3754_24485 [Alcanivorax sp. HI0083]